LDDHSLLTNLEISLKHFNNLCCLEEWALQTTELTSIHLAVCGLLCRLLQDLVEHDAGNNKEDCSENEEEGLFVIISVI